MEGAHHSSSSLPTAGSVNIERAETSFHELSRQLTQGTVVDDEEQAAGYSRANESRKTRDVEKGGLDAERPFDLREYLTSSNDANERAGIKHKHVGVLWDDFHVDVLGGSDFKVGGKPLQGVTIADSSDRGNSSLFARSEVSRWSVRHELSIKDSPFLRRGMAILDHPVLQVATSHFRSSPFSDQE